MVSTRQIPLRILSTYYNTAKYLFGRGLVSEIEFREQATKILDEMGYPIKAQEDIITRSILSERR